MPKGMRGREKKPGSQTSVEQEEGGTAQTNPCDLGKGELPVR